VTPAKLRVIGRLLYGRRWQTPLAYAVGVHPRTVTRWERGDTAMPEDLPERLRHAAELAVERSQHALGVVDELL
jgi:hypothetical protein